MLKILKQIRKGGGYLPGYGNHPGTILLFALPIVVVVTGLDNGIISAMTAGILMFLTVGIGWCIGCITRANDYDRSKQTDKIL